MSTAKFDDYARNYSQVHNSVLGDSGESFEYFSAYKLACLERLGARLDEPLLDYGCGIGNVTKAFATRFQDVHGYDPSVESLTVARQAIPNGTFHHDAEQIPEGFFSTAVLSCVLHHIPPRERPALMERVRSRLRPNGKLVVFEHNPLNPLTRRLVANCPFDDDAELLWPPQIRRLFRDAGFRSVRRDYIVFFPRFLAPLRPLEPRLRWLPLGAQTLVVGTR